MATQQMAELQIAARWRHLQEHAPSVLDIAGVTRKLGEARPSDTSARPGDQLVDRKKLHDRMVVLGQQMATESGRSGSYVEG